MKLSVKQEQNRCYFFKKKINRQRLRDFASAWSRLFCMRMLNAKRTPHETKSVSPLFAYLHRLNAPRGSLFSGAEQPMTLAPPLRLPFWFVALALPGRLLASFPIGQVTSRLSSGAPSRAFACACTLYELCKLIFVVSVAPSLGRSAEPLLWVYRAFPKLLFAPSQAVLVCTKVQVLFLFSSCCSLHLPFVLSLFMIFTLPLFLASFYTFTI